VAAHVSHQQKHEPGEFNEILDAFEFVSFAPAGENAAYLSPETGAIYIHSEFGDNFEELPPDIHEEGKYLAIPRKNDLGLGKRLAIEFAEDVLVDDLGKVRELFRAPNKMTLVR